MGAQRKPLQPGDRFGMLTVIGKDDEKTKLKKKQYYFCQCDCGSPIKSIRKDLLFLKDNSVVSCGCQSKQGQKEKLIDRESQTSFPEQAIFFYMSRAYGAQNRYLFHNREIDVFIPSLNVGIEYDGEYFHSSAQSKQREEKKDLYLKEHGIRVIRVKESHHDELVGDYIFCKPDSKYLYINNVIAQIATLLGFENPIDVNIERDSSDIFSLYIQTQKERSLQSVFPELATEWDNDKNGTLSPEMISAGSKKRVWWKCKKGHSWKAAVYSRKNNGCPCCSGKILVRGENDLLTQNPKLAEEWDYDKNGVLTPSDVTINNGKKVWWKCSMCGHVWAATPAHRNADRGCPECAKRIRSDTFCKTRIKDVGSLADHYPEIAAEWDYERNEKYTPQSVSPHSGRKVWWICKRCGHKWQANISNRVKGAGCPNCSQEQRSQSITQFAVSKAGSLSTTHPGLAAEWDYVKNGELTPSDVSYGTPRKVWWICKKGHSFSASVANRARLNRGCPYCAGNKVLVGFNDLATTHPNIANEWHPTKNGALLPTEFSAGSSKKVYWKCAQCGHEWPAQIGNRSQGQGCPVCSAQKLGLKHKKKINQYSMDGKLIKTYPSITEAAQAVGTTVANISKALKRKSKTTAGYIWDLTD